MKGRVEDGDLRQSLAEYIPRGIDAFDVRRIMQRREINAIFDPTQVLHQ